MAFTSTQRTRSAQQRLSTLVSRLCISSIRGYQKGISPFLPGRCRFYPTCSHYAIGSIQTLGLKKGLYESIKRLLRCHPFHPGGVDLVKGSTI